MLLCLKCCRITVGSIEWLQGLILFYSVAEDEEDEGEASEEFGGLFHVSRPDKESKRKSDALDCSKFLVEAPHDWDLDEVLPLETECCITVFLKLYVLGMAKDNRSLFFNAIKPLILDNYVG